MELEQAIRTRRTHKAYGPRELGPDVLDELFELASWAPNHHLTNPWRFHVIGQRTRERLIDLAEAIQPGSAIKLMRAPTLVAVCAQLSGDDSSQQREDILATAVAAYIVLLGAHSRGLAGYWRTVGLLDDPQARDLLGLSDMESPVGLLYLGDPVQEQRVPERAPLSDVVSYLP